MMVFLAAWLFSVMSAIFMELSSCRQAAIAAGAGWSIR